MFDFKLEKTGQFVPELSWSIVILAICSNRSLHMLIDPMQEQHVLMNVNCCAHLSFLFFDV